MNIANATRPSGPVKSCLWFARALSAGDLDQAAACFARDGCLITPDATAVHGREEIRAVLGQMVSRQTEVEVELSSTVAAGEMILASQRWRIRSGEPGERRLEQTANAVLVCGGSKASGNSRSSPPGVTGRPFRRRECRPGGYLCDMSAGDANAKRAYRMGARAQSTEATRLKILEAVEATFEELFYDEITLEAVAERAGVSVQTVLRHFESKDNLFVASYLHTGEKMGADRGTPPTGDLKAIVDDLVDHYERFGYRILWMLAQEEREPILKNLADLGRLFHLQWCRQAFAPSLVGLRGKTRERRLAQFVAGTDLYTWKLLRRDRELSREQTKLAMRELLEPLI